MGEHEKAEKTAENKKGRSQRKSEQETDASKNERLAI